MPNGLYVLASMIGIVCLVSLWQSTRWGGRRRQRRLRQFAESRGWRYDDVLSRPTPEEQWALPEGPGGLRQNVLTGVVDDSAFSAFECDWRVQGHVSAQGGLMHYAVVLVAAPVDTPVLDVFPTGWASRVAEAIGVDGSTELESAAFNERFQVLSPERQFAVDVLRPEVMELLMATSALAWRINDGVCSLRYQGGHDPETVSHRIAELVALRNAIPDWVWQRWATAS